MAATGGLLSGQISAFAGHQESTSSQRMPVIFAGHGSPMNALEGNSFTTGWYDMVKGLPKPHAILCISAHWETSGTHITAMEHPRTIHDFYGFPDALYQLQYQAPGSPEIANKSRQLAGDLAVLPDTSWGLDHGTWSILRHMYPDASIPVLQLSLDYTKKPSEHFELARLLGPLRDQGILVIGSGNLVHNLRLIDWRKPEHGYDWAESAEATFRSKIEQHDPAGLFNPDKISKETALAVPTPEHFLPLLYVMGMRKPGEDVRFFNDQRIYGSLSMTSLLIN